MTGPCREEASQVFVVRGSLHVLDVRLRLDLNSAVSKLLIADAVLVITATAGASPVPVHAAGELQARHLLIRQVGDDLEHVAAVAVDAEDVVVDELRLPEAFLEEQGAADERSDGPLRLHGVLVEKFLHVATYLIINYNCTFCKARPFLR